MYIVSIIFISYFFIWVGGGGVKIFVNFCQFWIFREIFKIENFEDREQKKNQKCNFLRSCIFKKKINGIQ